MHILAKQKAAYLGTFDPLTLGHLDLIQRASALFPHLCVGVAASRDKKPLFQLEQRIDLVKQACADLDGIEVREFSGLAVNFLKEEKISILIRGIRGGQDLDHEMQMASMNATLAPKIETIFIPSRPQFQCISSSLVKEIARMDGDISKLVHPCVQKSLEEITRSPLV